MLNLEGEDGASNRAQNVAAGSSFSATLRCECNKRARSTKRSAWLCVFIAMVILGLGVISFIRVPSLTQNEIDTSLSQINRLIDEEEMKLNDLNDNDSLKTNILRDLVGLKERRDEILSGGKPLSQINKLISKEEDKLKTLSAESDNALRSNILRDLTGLKELRDQIISEESGSTKQISEVFWWQTNSLRISILVIVIFASQNFFVLARYNFRLSAFYAARADAAGLTAAQGGPWPNHVEKFTQVVHALSPDVLDYGRTPQSMMGRAIRWARQSTRSRPN